MQNDPIPQKITRLSDHHVMSDAFSHYFGENVSEVDADHPNKDEYLSFFHAYVDTLVLLNDYLERQKIELELENLNLKKQKQELELEQKLELEKQGLPKNIENLINLLNTKLSSEEGEEFIQNPNPEIWKKWLSEITMEKKPNIKTTAFFNDGNNMTTMIITDELTICAAT